MSDAPNDVISNYQPPAASPEGVAAAKAALTGWFRALHAKDLAAIQALMTDDIVIEIPFHESGKTDRASYRIYTGRQQVTELWATAFKAEGVVHGASETDFTMTADGSRAFLETRFHLTMSSGKEYRNRYVMRFDFENGKIKHNKEYYNPIQSAYAFGRQLAGQFMIESL